MNEGEAFVISSSKGNKLNDGQAEAEGGTHPGTFALNPNTAAVRFHQVFGNRQANAAATPMPVSGTCRRGKSG